jgi:hypothetical protein
MINFSAIATDLDLKDLGFFEANLNPHLPANQQVMEQFWSKFPKQYARTKINAVTPQVAMKAFVDWMKEVGKSKDIAMMALPAGYDKMFLQTYMVHFGNKPRGGIDGVGSIDIESLLMILKKKDYREIDHPMDAPEWIQPKIDHSHYSVEDVIEQTTLGVNALRFSRGLQPVFFEKETVERILTLSDNAFGLRGNK